MSHIHLIAKVKSPNLKDAGLLALHISVKVCEVLTVPTTKYLPLLNNYYLPVEGGEAVVRPPAEVGGEEGVVVQQGVELGGQEGGVRVVEGVNIGVGGQQRGVVSAPEHHGNLDTMIIIIYRDCM